MSDIKYSRTSYAFTTFGIITFAVSVSILITADFPNIQKQGSAPLWFLPTLLVVFTFAGTLLSTFRMGTTISQSNDSVIIWWGFVTPMNSSSHKLSEFHKLKLVYETQFSGTKTDRGGKQSYVYRLYLYNELKSLPITYHSKRAKAEAKASFLADALGTAGFEFVDTTENHPKSLFGAIKQAHNFIKKNV